MDFDIRELTIERLGGRGEGVARGPSGPVYVPYALPGERVRAYVERERARVTEIIVPSPDRIPAFCPHFGTCGGCAIQNLAAEPYAAWKRGLVVTALEQAKVVADVAPLVDAHGEGRRRATFHARFSTDAAGRWNIEVGFMQARAHNIIDIDQCPILAPSMVEAAAAARAVAEALSGVGKPLDILVNATLEGLDIDPLGASAVPKVVAVSCSAGTFARDAKILVAAGYALDKVTPVDQFRHAPHVEIVGVFSRPKVKAGRRGRLLG